MRSACVILALLGAGCATRLESADWQSRLARGGPVRDAAAVDASWRSGDLLTYTALRYRIVRERSGHEPRVWTLELHGTDRTRGEFGQITANVRSAGSTARSTDYTTELWPAQLYVQRPEGGWEDEIAPLALGFLGDDLYRTAALFLAPDHLERQADDGAYARVCARHFGGALGAMVSLGTALEQSATLQSIAKEVVQWPSLTSLLRLRLDVNLDPRFEAVRRVDTAQGPGLAVPFELTINGDQAFVGELRLVDPAGALELVAGVVEIVGFAPHRPDDALRIELVGEVAHAALAARPDAERVPIEPVVEESWLLDDAADIRLNADD